MKHRIAALVLVLIITGVSGYFAFRPEKTTDVTPRQPAKQTEKPTEETPQEKKFDKALYSVDDPASLWVVVNKKRPLRPANYVPADLTVPNIQLRSNITSDERQVRTAVAEALKSLAEAAKSESLTLTLESGYRSYNFQANLYNRYVNQQGQAVADTQSARAGYSEHQTGLGADLGGTTRPACNVEACFAETPEGKWIAANVYKYGFIVRYPESKPDVTGYIYEPWHLRYVGNELATEMRDKGILTMEEFFGLPAAPSYN